MREESNAIEARGLVKRFGKTTALAGVDLTAHAGSVLGLLGPNGAGKTTAVRILATLLRPDAGEARVCGYDVVREAYQVRQLIGLTGQYASVDEGLRQGIRLGELAQFANRAGRLAQRQVRLDAVEDRGGAQLLQPGGGGGRELLPRHVGEGGTAPGGQGVAEQAGRRRRVPGRQRAAAGPGGGLEDRRVHRLRRDGEPVAGRG